VLIEIVVPVAYYRELKFDYMEISLFVKQVNEFLNVVMKNGLAAIFVPKYFETFPE